jgi:large subunit ribosomal protein L2
MVKFANNLQIKKLKHILPKNSGRNSLGHITVRHQGGRQKRYYRSIDFKRDKHDVTARVLVIEYDPNRTSDIALIQYQDGEKRYILAPIGLKVGQSVMSGKLAEIIPGNAMPLRRVPIGTPIHNIEFIPGMGGKVIRSAGTMATVLAVEGVYANVKMPSGEVRKILADCFATIGQLGNVEHRNEHIGKAGRARLMGKRPEVRGVAQNPRSHPHGGGEGRSGIGMTTPKTYAGRPAVGKTRNRKKYSNKMILQRRKPGKHS